MKIIEKFRAKSEDLNGGCPVTVAFLGDSVTQGCFEVYETSETGIETVFDAEYAYHTMFRKILNNLYPDVPLNIINAGISGGNAVQGYERLERDVLRFSPDLCVVCFGLNDSCREPHTAEGVAVYTDALKKIFSALKEKGIEIIYMTPNFMCTHVQYGMKSPTIRKIAENVSKVQQSGRLESFLKAGISLAEEMDIPVCDCYSKWKALYEGGVNINALLANGINHPTREMNRLFAYSLAETIFLK